MNFFLLVIVLYPKQTLWRSFMKRFCIIFSCLAGVFLFNHLTFAEPDHHRMHGENKNFQQNRWEQHKEIFEKLGLSNEQKDQLKNIHEKDRGKMKENHKKIKELREALHQSMESDVSDEVLMKKFQEIQNLHQEIAKQRFQHILAIRKMLNQEQRKKFHEFKEQFHKQKFQADHDGLDFQDEEEKE